MTTSEPARHPDAIASALEPLLQPWDIEISTIAIAANCLETTLVAPPECDSVAVITTLQQQIAALNLKDINCWRLTWQIRGKTNPQWQREIELNPTDLVVETEKTPPKGRLGAIAGQFKNVGQTVTQARKNITENASNFFSQTTSQAANNLGNAVDHTTTQAQNLMKGAAEAVGNVVDTTGKTFSSVGNTVGNTATQAQHLITGASNVLETAVDSTGKTFSAVGNTVTNTVGNTANQIQETLNQAAQFVVESPLLEKIINNVDLVKAAEKLERIQAQHPDETAAQISRRLMLEKAIYAGGTGFATSVVPGAIAALIAVDLAAVAALQAEMVYQISGAYGLDLQAPERKSEILAIFGLALGSGQAVRAGVTLLQTTPVIGAAIGASSNAAMIYAVGYAACRFYEAKIQDDSSEVAAIASAQAGVAVLEDAIAQETVMDRIIVQLLRVGYPEKTWADIQPELIAANLSPASLEALATHFNSPEPLDTLLAQINPDFAVPLLAQCHKIAELNGVVSPAEAAILEQIRQTFQINLAALLESQVS
ncbi:MAG: EcsC family protein [Jaaginema sp. PMC 1079.18]|nr:EcsC family protein [Jaaginema sp. PMC 1080.18]MEC4851728.1 EcsC family protein [Jaaginema sp. PMC 1079.18]MEC4865801.1 EcsC family protein [Jaaginema sp. PMC 1078.18]